MIKSLIVILILPFLVFPQSETDTSSDSLSKSNTRSASNLSREGRVPLTWSKYELNRISEFTEGLFNYGKDATEHIFKNNVDKYSIIHLASHTVINDSDPNLSHISFSPEDNIEDGLLNIYEIYNLRINADMIILSSCNTGMGKIVTGEGALSLARAFMYAGSPSVIMSLWDIDDRATSEIMVSFYRNLSEGKKKDDALNNAKLDYLKNADQYTANPVYWGGLVTIGSQSNIKINSDSHINIIILILVSAALILLSIVVILRKKNLLLA